MAEDVVTNAAFAAKLPKKACVTRDLAIGDASSKKGNAFLHDSFTFSEPDIIRFAEEEMAMTVEDILSRRTRLLLLNAQAAIEAAPFVARIMATVLNKNEQWINEQIEDFTELANNYKL